MMLTLHLVLAIAAVPHGDLAAMAAAAAPSAAPSASAESVDPDLIPRNEVSEKKSA